MKRLRARMQGFAVLLKEWYLRNYRELPWRNTNDPYAVWLSEIILQQTRVAQGLPYYQRFIEKYPVVKDLANAPLDEVLRLWQGLGYYSRARNLHQAAKQVIDVYQGIFPSDYDQIRNLKGIGDYTAAAIISFAFGKPYPVIDGNVIRFLSRLAGITHPVDTSAGRKKIVKLAHELIDKTDPATFNQGIMEFGALICKPVNPNCQECPFRLNCKAFSLDIISEIPIKQSKTKVRSRYFNYLVIDNDGKTVIRQRTGKDIWEGLFEFPMKETDGEPENFPDGILTVDTYQVNGFPVKIKHKLSHQDIYASFWKVKIKGETFENPEFRIVQEDDLQYFAMPRLIVKYLENNPVGNIQNPANPE